MIPFLKRCMKNTIDKREQNRMLLIKLGCIMMAALIFAGISEVTVKAASGLRLYDYATSGLSTYTGKQVKVTCNGTSIGNAKYPGILVNGVALLPVYDIFDKLPIDADYTYDDKTGGITISKYNKIIHMTVGSTIATVNNKQVTLSVAPKKIKYVDSDAVKVLVPSRFVSENLGLGYTWKSDTNTVAIVKHTLALSHNGGEVFEYTGAQGKVTLDGRQVSLGKTPSIIINDTAMLSAYKVFSESKIGAKYSYDKTTQTVTLSKGSNVLVMTVGSLEAVYNNNTITLPAAPALVQYCEAKIARILVPGQVTADCLGYSYTWNNALRTSVISTKEDNTDPSDHTGTILNQWSSTLPYGDSSNVHELNGSDLAVSGTLYSVSRDTNSSKQNAETFLFYSNAPFHKLTSSKSGKKITITAAGENCIDQTYQMYGVSSNFINTITLSNTSDQSTLIDIDGIQEAYDYDISLSSDQQILYVTVYLNTLKSAVIQTNSTGDYLTLSGAKPLNAEITEASDYIHIDLPYAINSLGYLNTEITNSKFIRQFFTISMQDKTQLILLMKEGYQYSTSKNGNDLTISFQSGSSDNGGIPAVTDTSEYNVRIPKPIDVTSTMISDEDYYLKHYFEITLQGSYTDYFKTNAIENQSKTVSSTSVSLDGSGNTVIKIATSKLQGYKLAYDNDYIYVKVGDSNTIYKNIVVLDPGHGGSDTGARKNGINEKDLNLKILYTIGKKYFDQDPSELKVYWTRTTDVKPSLTDRAAFVKTVGADLFVCLHMNSVENDTRVQGTEVFYSKENNSANKAGLTSTKLAELLDASLISEMGTSDRGVKQAAYVVLKKNTVPAVLIELGFMTNAKDFSMINDENYQNVAAETIYNTLLQIFAEFPTGR